MMMLYCLLLRGPAAVALLWPSTMMMLMKLPQRQTKRLCPALRFQWVETSHLALLRPWALRRWWSLLCPPWFQCYYKAFQLHKLWSDDEELLVVYCETVCRRWHLFVSIVSNEVRNEMWMKSRGNGRSSLSWTLNAEWTMNTGNWNFLQHSWPYYCCVHSLLKYNSIMGGNDDLVYPNLVNCRIAANSSTPSSLPSPPPSAASILTRIEKSSYQKPSLTRYKFTVEREVLQRAKEREEK